jgi:starch-binding outer membrane protein, SusD/RagB family
MRLFKHTFILVGILSIFVSCEDFITVDPPQSALVRKTVFDSEETADRAILGIYADMANGIGFASGDIQSISFTASLSADELQNYNTAFPELNQFANNTLLPANNIVLSLWSDLYQTIYRANAVMEGVEASAVLPEPRKASLSAEAKFIRAFCYFYLVNLWGDVPLALTTDYRKNTNIARTETALTYGQLITDLEEAKLNLPSLSTNHLRPTKEAAAALLSRIYLFTGDWSNAIANATELIAGVPVIEPDLNNVFLTTSKEAIWQLARDNTNASEARLLTFTAQPVNAALRGSFVSSFEADDKRKTSWLGSTTVNSAVFYFPRKYKNVSYTPVTEYSIVLRLAEQYLIRAEANARLGKLPEAIADLDVIRNRAGLPSLQNTNPGINQADLLMAVERERRSELFTEWGHRWFDLKRFDLADEILLSMKPEWTATAGLYPIPATQITNDPAMSSQQNPGY